MKDTTEFTPQETYPPITFPKEVYFRESGTYRYQFENGTSITGVSANTWEDFIRYLSQTTREDKIIVSPECITFTDRPFRELAENKEEIEGKIEQLKKISKERLETVFVIGTPTFLKVGKPRNSAVAIKNGEVIMTTNKRTGASAEENEYFDLPAEEPPAKIPGTNIALLICSDMPISTLYTRPFMPDINAILRLAGIKNLIGKNPKFIDKGTKGLVLMSCWATGSRFPLKDKDKDSHYRDNLRSNARFVILRLLNNIF